AQVYIRSEDDAHGVARTYVFISAMAFVHAIFVAGERHNPPQLAELAKHVLYSGSQGHSPDVTYLSCYQFKFPHAPAFGQGSNTRLGSFLCSGFVFTP